MEQRRATATAGTRGQVGVHELPDVLRSPEILQPMQAEVERVRACVGSVSATQSRVASETSDLAAVRDRADARAADDRRAEVVARVAQLDLAGVERHAHRSSAPSGQGSAANARCASSAAATASDAAANAPTTLSPSPCSTGRTPPWCAIAASEELVVTGDRGRHLVGARLPELRRALDVGQQEGHRAGRQGKPCRSTPVTSASTHNGQPSPRCTASTMRPRWTSASPGTSANRWISDLRRCSGAEGGLCLGIGGLRLRLSV